MDLVNEMETEEKWKKYKEELLTDSVDLTDSERKRIAEQK